MRDPPDTAAIDREVSFAVVVIVGSDGPVGRDAEGKCVEVLSRCSGRTGDVPGSIRRPKDGEAGLAVAVKITVERNVSVSSKGIDRNLVVRTAVGVPDRGRRAKYGEIGFSVTVVIAKHRHVTVRSELDRPKRAGRAVQSIPSAVRRAKYRNPSSSVTVEVSGSRQVAGQTKNIDSSLPVRRLINVPNSVSENGPVGLPVAVVIGRSEFVGGNSPFESRVTVISAVQIVPDSVHRPIYSEIVLPVVLKIRVDPVSEIRILLRDDRAEDTLTGVCRAVTSDLSLLSLEEALTNLEKIDPRQARIVELRFFGGLSIEEAAHVLSISETTIKREWTFAKAWFQRELG